jgi:hypothetical protein
MGMEGVVVVLRSRLGLVRTSPGVVGTVHQSVPGPSHLVCVQREPTY